MRKNLNKGMAVFMAIGVIALNFGLIGNVLADELENSDQALAMPIKDRGISNPQPIETPVTVDQNLGSGPSNVDKITICHFPSSNPTTMEISHSALAGHLGHGDTLGACTGSINFCTAQLQNVKNYQNVKANILTGSYDPAFDLNGDGSINLTDVTIATNARPSADINGDGIVNLIDVVLAVQCHENPIANGMINSFVATDSPVLTQHSPWCSALLGMMNLTEYRNNKVIDINDSKNVDGLDVGLLVNLYYNNDNDACYARFEPTQGQYNFDQSDYQNIDWCSGIKQGIKDSIGSNLGEARYSSIFDLNHDNAINLTDVVLMAQLVNSGDQAVCYGHYGFPPMTNSDTPPVAPVSDDSNSGGGHGGNAPMFTPLVTSPIVTPQVLGEKIVECKNKPNTTLTQFANGTLIRGCGPQIYIIKDGQKMHIPNLDLLRNKYLGKPILNIGNLINTIKDWSAKLAIK